MPSPAEKSDPPTVYKPPARVRTFTADFSREPEILAGDTLATPTVPAVSGLTFGSPAVTAAIVDGVPAAKGVSVTISGGTADTAYPVEIRCTTAGGATLVCELIVQA